MAEVVAWTAIAMSVISFAVYLGFSSGRMGGEETKQAVKAADAASEHVRRLTAPTPAQVADLVKALASLTDSLVKAGPALWSLIGSALFLLLAAVAAGAIGGEAGEGGGSGTNISADRKAPDEATNQTGNENLEVK